MSSIAHYLLDKDVTISGSDIRTNHATSSLVSRGCNIFSTHEASHINGAEVIVVSDAISPHNPEVAEAMRLGCLVTKRARFLQDLGIDKSSIHVTGTHGKSTTAAMIATVLMETGANPDFILGADVTGLDGKRARAVSDQSNGNYFVAEACEAFRNLLHYSPDFAVITNIDDDHLEHYGDQASLDLAFSEFARRVVNRGVLIINGDDPGLQRIRPTLGTEVITYGLTENNDISASQLVLYGHGSSFSVSNQCGVLGKVSLSVPGRHMVENALACIGMCLSLGISFQATVKTLSHFKGVSHRWNDHGEFAGIRVIEDFAHHPTELLVNLETARLSQKQDQRVILAFQPQLFSRTKLLSRAYASVINQYDAGFLLHIDGGGESFNDKVSSQNIINQINDSGHAVSCHQNVGNLVASLVDFLKPGDLVLIAGGADIQHAVKLLLTRLAGKYEQHAGCRRLLRTGLVQRKTSADREDADNALSLLMHHFKTSPTSTAVSSGTDILTYAELDLISMYLSSFLVQVGLRRGGVVALGLPPSIDQVVCQVSVLRAGGSCLCLDEKLPGQRLSFMLDVANADFLITQQGSEIDNVLAHANKLYLKEIISQPVGFDNTKVPVWAQDQAQGQDTAYICFTSGSTGQPKGIPITHAALFAFLPAAIERFHLANSAKTVLNSSQSFDASIAELMLTLSIGGEVHIPVHRGPLVGRKLHEFIDRHQITHLFATPSVLSTLPVSRLSSLRTIVAGGEVCPQSLADDLSVHAQLINGYGPTEATIYSTAWQYVTGETICIGKPLAHLDVHLLDKNNHATPAGDIGEICLSGVGVCDRYLTDGNNYDEKFISLLAGNGTVSTSLQDW